MFNRKVEPPTGAALEEAVGRLASAVGWRCERPGTPPSPAVPYPDNSFAPIKAIGRHWEEVWTY